MTLSSLMDRQSTRARTMAARLTRQLTPERAGDRTLACERILYVANSYLPTLQLSFVKPLQAEVERGSVATELLSQQQVEILWGRWSGSARAQRWVERRFHAFNPTLVVFCRYSGQHGQVLLQLAKQKGIATIYHIDDDLLSVPPEIGRAKFAFHNEPKRKAAVEHLLRHADLVYCSTPALLDRFRSLGLVDERGVAGNIYCSGEVRRAHPAADTPLIIGYMGFDHAHDLELALPALIQVLDKHAHVQFELFGSIPKPDSLARFGTRVRTVPPEAGYDTFMAKFASLGWSIGICPLANTPFNRLKANTKWVEYTSIGAAVVATGGTVYDSCCNNGCGMLAGTEIEWLEALELLVQSHAIRLQNVGRAQERMARDFSLEALRRQLLNVFALSRRPSIP